MSPNSTSRPSGKASITSHGVTSQGTPQSTPHHQDRGTLKINNNFFRAYAMESKRPWEDEMKEILKLVDSGAFGSVYEDPTSH